MQRRLAKLFLFASTLAIFQPLWGQQPTGQVRKLAQLPATTVYEDTQWSPDQDIQLLKGNIRSQKKQIVAANMELSDAEAEKFWPVYNRYAEDVAKIYDTKIALFQEYLETYDSCLGKRPKVIYTGAPQWRKTSCKSGSSICLSFAKCLRGEKPRSFTKSIGGSI